MLMKMLVVEPDLPGSIDDKVRPFRRVTRGQRWPGLWAHVMPPRTMRGILLWIDGRCEIVDNWDNFTTFTSSDAQLGGGAQVVLDDSSWEYANLVSHGFQFEVVPA